jgi:hypothetical protein
MPLISPACRPDSSTEACYPLENQNLYSRLFRGLERAGGGVGGGVELGRRRQVL